MMKRVILDTNIYGKIIREEETDFVIEHAKKSGFVIYGCDAIRKELRKTAKDKTTHYSGKIEKIRLLLLRLYRLLVEYSREIDVTEEMEEIADAYYVSYKTAGGNRSKDEMMDDFRIVAAATKKKLEVVYSEDNRTMLCDEAKNAYNTVNSIKDEKTPNFKSYGEFKNDIN